jgi:hypothetical protein
MARDHRVQLQLRTVHLSSRVTTATLRQAIVHAARSYGPVKRVAFSAIKVGRLRGLSGTAIYARKPYRLVVVAVPDRSGRHVFVLAAVVRSKATARDLRQYKALVASLRPTR